MTMAYILAGFGIGIVGVLVSLALAWALTSLVYRNRNTLGRKVGGLYHWRVGRVGGSFYLSKGGAK